jgi:hypothetical protein
MRAPGRSKGAITYRQPAMSAEHKMSLASRAHQAGMFNRSCQERNNAFPDANLASKAAIERKNATTESKILPPWPRLRETDTEQKQTGRKDVGFRPSASSVNPAPAGTPNRAYRRIAFRNLGRHIRLNMTR